MLPGIIREGSLQSGGPILRRRNRIGKMARRKEGSVRL